MAWFFSQEATPYTNAVRQYLKVAEAIVPDVWPYEIANVLYIGLKHGRCTETDIVPWTKLLLALPIRVEAATVSSVLVTVLNASIKHQLTAYDAAYLELAMRHDVPLATLDKKLSVVATKLGIEPLDPFHLTK